MQENQPFDSATHDYQIKQKEAKELDKLFSSVDDILNSASNSPTVNISATPTYGSNSVNINKTSTNVDPDKKQLFVGNVLVMETSNSGYFNIVKEYIERKGEMDIAVLHTIMKVRMLESHLENAKESLVSMKFHASTGNNAMFKFEKSKYETYSNEIKSITEEIKSFKGLLNEK